MSKETEGQQGYSVAGERRALTFYLCRVVLTRHPRERWAATAIPAQHCLVGCVVERVTERRFLHSHE